MRNLTNLRNLRRMNSSRVKPAEKIFIISGNITKSNTKSMFCKYAGTQLYRLIWQVFVHFAHCLDCFDCTTSPHRWSGQGRGGSVFSKPKTYSELKTLFVLGSGFCESDRSKPTHNLKADQPAAKGRRHKKRRMLQRIPPV